MMAASGCLSASLTRVGGDLTASLTRVGGDLTASLTLICEFNGSYLRANPKTLWVSEDIIQQLLIESNVSWMIE